MWSTAECLSSRPHLVTNFSETLPHVLFGSRKFRDSLGGGAESVWLRTPDSGICYERLGGLCGQVEQPPVTIGPPTTEIVTYGLLILIPPFPERCFTCGGPRKYSQGGFALAEHCLKLPHKLSCTPGSPLTIYSKFMALLSEGVDFTSHGCIMIYVVGQGVVTGVYLQR
jgi:hypothetical protein